MSAEPSLTIVVPTWNRAQLLNGALTALLEQTVDPDRYEIVVVDDGSTDGTVGIVAGFAAVARQHCVRYVSRPNGGVNAARNSGVGIASGAAVAFVDDDELVPPGWVAAVLAAIEAHPDTSGVGGPYVDAPGEGVRTCDRCSLGGARLAVDGEGYVHRLLGGNMALRRSALDDVGPFHEALRGRGDENEWFSRATSAGHRFWYAENLFLWHRRDTMTLLDLCRTQFRQGKALPRSHALRGVPWRPRPLRTGRYVGHAIRRRCGKGMVLAARDLGAAVAWIGMRFRR